MEENEEKCSWPTICSGVTDGMTQERVGKWKTTFTVINGIYILCNLWVSFLTCTVISDITFKRPLTDHSHSTVLTLAVIFPA
ncbi:hypothetical protein SDJN03_05938, partial [Cucurbita argyrosperma subsp. sororia]